MREKVPTWWLNCALPLGAAAARRLVVPCSSQRWLCRVPFGGVGSCFAFPNDCPCAFHPPRPIGSSLLVLKLPLLVPSGAGRGLKVCSSCRRFVLRASNGFPARTGATRAAKPPKTERGAFPTKRACRESAALGFPPCGGRRPPIGTLPLRCEAGRKPRVSGRSL